MICILERYQIKRRKAGRIKGLKAYEGMYAK